MKNNKRIPRKIKKSLGKNGVLVYDVSSLPNRQTIKSIMYDFNNFGLVLWASAANDNYSGKDCNNPPMVVGNVRKFKVIDVSNK